MDRLINLRKHFPRGSGQLRLLVCCSLTFSDHLHATSQLVSILSPSAQAATVTRVLTATYGPVPRVSKVPTHSRSLSFYYSYLRRCPSPSDDSRNSTLSCYVSLKYRQHSIHDLDGQIRPRDLCSFVTSPSPTLTHPQFTTKNHEVSFGNRPRFEFDEKTCWVEGWVERFNCSKLKILDVNL